MVKSEPLTLKRVLWMLDLISGASEEAKMKRSLAFGPVTEAVREEIEALALSWIDQGKETRDLRFELLDVKHERDQTCVNLEAMVRTALTVLFCWDNEDDDGLAPAIKALRDATKDARGK